jgi:GntR family transcriptional regulator, transcriptional repressor for pyruvate dehydrogenase complex
MMAIWSDQPDHAGMSGSDADVSGQVVQRLQELIRGGTFPPGTLLPSQRLLAAQLQVSRTSLREGLSVLEAIGVLQTAPRRGTLVVDAQASGPPSLEQAGTRYAAEDVYQFRFVVEGDAARRAAQRATPREVASLHANLLAFKQATAARDLMTMARLDFEFHRLLVSLSGNRLVADLHKSHASVLLASQRLPLARAERLWEPLSEHGNIVEAIERRDPDGARYFMQTHILRAAERLGVRLSEDLRCSIPDGWQS